MPRLQHSRRVSLVPSRAGEYYEPEGRDLRRLVSVYRGWLYLPDPAVLEIVFASVAANYMPGPAVWTMLIGPPSSGKTLLLMSLADLPKVHVISDITFAGFLSASSAKDVRRGATGGLLREIGDFGLAVLKDFTSVLSLRHEARQMILGALREIHDGTWSRNVGVDGGSRIAWSGKLGVLAGCTGAYDSHHSVVASLGERFVLFRFDGDGEREARRAMCSSSANAERSAELREAVADFFEGRDFGEPPELLSGERERLLGMASFSARARSSVERDGFRREILMVHEPEHPARLAVSLTRLFHGLLAIGTGNHEAWRVIRRAAWDCIPSPRRQVLTALLDSPEPLGTGELAAAFNYPYMTALRALEDLRAHRVVREQGSRQVALTGKTAKKSWRLTADATAKYSRGFAEGRGDE